MAGRQWVQELVFWGRMLWGLPPTYLQGCHADDFISMVEESGQDIKYGRFREY